MLYDCAIIGTGPAGVAAALQLKTRDARFLWLGSKNLSDKVVRAERISNYPGFLNVSGADLNAAFKMQIKAMGIEITEQMATGVAPFGDHFGLMAGPDFYEAKTVILATGAVMRATLPQEGEYLGRGVSYCATCDGGLYRDRTVAVLITNPRFEAEVRYLAGLAEKVFVFPAYAPKNGFGENAEVMGAKITGLVADERVTELTLSTGETLAVDGLFCLRDAVALQTLFAGLATENGHIKVDRQQKTSVPGVFAAGDCTGLPYQYAKAVGEGNVAAHSALAYLDL